MDQYYRDPYTHVCIQARWHCIQITGSGHAICAPDDQWSSRRGHDIALGRAVADAARQIQQLDWREQCVAEAAKKTEAPDRAQPVFQKWRELYGTHPGHRCVSVPGLEFGGQPGARPFIMSWKKLSESLARWDAKREAGATRAPIGVAQEDIKAGQAVAVDKDTGRLVVASQANAEPALPKGYGQLIEEVLRDIEGFSTSAAAGQRLDVVLEAVGNAVDSEVARIRARFGLPPMASQKPEAAKATTPAGP